MSHNHTPLPPRRFGEQDEPYQPDRDSWQYAGPHDDDEPAPALPDPPYVRVRPRHDGWTPARQHEFIMRLADTGSVRGAADRVGMSTQSAYRLRRHPDAQDFRDAWDRAVEQAGALLVEAAMERALHGEIEIVERAGNVIETRQRPCSDRLLMFMIERQERAKRRRAWAARGAFPDPADLDTAELAGLAITAENFPDRAGWDGPELEANDFYRRAEAPRIVSPPAGHAVLLPDSSRLKTAVQRPRAGNAKREGV